MLYTGVVENRNDPLKLGRCQVRIVGVHTDDKQMLPTEQLPWAFPMQPVTSAAMNGIGWTPVGPVPGTWVVILFRDEDCQQPIMIGSIGGIPQSKAAEKIIDNSDTVATDGGIVMNSLGVPLKAKDGADLGIDQGIKDTMGTLGETIGNLLGFDTNNLLASLLKNKPTGADTEGKETIIPKVVEKADAPINSQPTPAAADPKVLSSDIRVDPPAKFTTDVGRARANITAIIAACDQVGLTSKYAKCAILGIVGGESGWLPEEEKTSFSADALRRVFYSAFKDNPAEAEQYARWKGSKEDFFERIYSHKYGNGQSVGNKFAGDGGKYFGRGFNGVTGRAGYSQLQKAMKKYGYDIDLLNNPGLLISDPNVCAMGCAVWYKTNVSTDMNDPAYFVEARKRTGKDANGGYAKKQTCYEYFLGQSVITDSTNKPTADQQKTYTKEEVAYLPESKQLALLEDRSGNATTGFTDPVGKYPLRNLLDEPDTNRLARGVIQETAIAFKDQIRTKGIDSANGAPSWEQPLAPFGGQYPYSKVFESESGHVQIYDDTPGHEMISFYHRKGTFLDIDANGTQVNKIVGDGYVIIDRNGLINIEGQCVITVGNSANILVKGNADIEVNGTATANVHGYLNVGVAKDVNMAVGGDFNLKVDGNFNTTVKGDYNTAVTGAIDTQADSSIYMQTDAGLAIQAKSNITTKTDALYVLDAGDEISIKSAASIKSQATGEYTIKSSSDMHIQAAGDSKIYSTGNFDLKALGAAKVTGGTSAHIRALGGMIAIDGTAFRAQQGSALPASTANAATADVVDSFKKFDALTLAAPEERATSGNLYELLQTPVRPAPPVEVKIDLLASNDAAFADFEKNPAKYYDARAAEAGVNPERPPQPDIGDAGKSLVSGAVAGDIAEFLQKQLALANEGYWTEKGMGGKPISQHNQNIVAMWKDIGLESVMGAKGDQQAWCMAFVNWVLKQCNYRYVQSARAFDIRDKPARWNATKVTKPEPGDIICWSYSHVSFVYQVTPSGMIIPCGGNQGGGKASDNNPSGGRVSINYKGGVSPTSSNIVGIYRPSKT